MTRNLSRRPKDNYENKAIPKSNIDKKFKNGDKKPVRTFKKYEKKLQNKLTEYFVHFYAEITTNRILTPSYQMPYSIIDETALQRHNLLSPELSREIKNYPDKYDLLGNTDNEEIELIESNILMTFVNHVFEENDTRIPNDLFFILEDGFITSANPELYDFPFLPFDCKSRKIEGISWLSPQKRDINRVLSNLDEIDFSIVTNIFTNIPELAHITEEYPQITLTFEDKLDYLVTSFYTIVDSNDEDNVHIYTNDPELRKILKEGWNN